MMSIRMSGQCPAQSDVPQQLNEELVRQLALLSGAPPGIAESTIALLRFGARTVFEELEMIELSGARRPYKITITEHGWHVIDECAQWVATATAEDWHRCRDVEDRHHQLAT